jgi:DNA-directed RNA polymerase specialized sigma24 family protein
VHLGECLPSEPFEQLAMPNFERLCNFACRLTHDRQEAEDCVQKTYAKALKCSYSFQPGTNFRAWIYRISTTFTIPMGTVMSRLSRARKRYAGACSTSLQIKDELKR